MSLHFVNSAHVRASQNLILRGGSFAKAPFPVRYGIFVHPVHGPIVIDAGYAPSLYNVPNASFLFRVYRSVMSPDLLTSGNPKHALRSLGYEISDVKHVMITHFHMDHIGYLDAFPHATVHVSSEAWDELRTVRAERLAHNGIFLEALPDDLDGRISLIDDRPRAEVSAFLGARDIFEDGTVITIPLPGHATGHYGLMFPQLPNAPLYAVDVAWTKPGLLEERERSLPVRFVSTSYAQARASAQAVRKHVEETGCDLILCHDPEPTPYDMWGGR